MATQTLSVMVGTHPDESEPEVSLSEDALSSGCYLGGDHPERQTALLHDWCVQWAERGHGFCYVHPRGPAPRELLARLPEHRLEDAVWIDFRRRRLPDSLAVPPARRVGVDPFAGPASGIDAGELRTDPVAGRCADWVAACKAGRDDVDWNAARALATLLPVAFRPDGPTGRELQDVLWEARGQSAHLDAVTEYLPPSGRTQLEHAVDVDADLLSTLVACLTEPCDPFPSNPLIGDATYPIEDAISNADIILVTGTLPTPDPYTTASIDSIGTYLLLQSVVRRLWEGAQQWNGDSTAQLPLVLDRVADCSPPADSLLPEVIGSAAHTPLVPILSGPQTEELPRRLKQPVTETIDARVQFTDPSAPGATSLPMGDLDAVEQAIDREQAHPVDSGPVCWVSTGNAGRLSGTPRADATTRPARPGDPPRTRHDADVLGAAITESVTRHGAIPDWLTEELLQETREE
jgi:hypothetical protein